MAELFGMRFVRATFDDQSIFVGEIFEGVHVDVDPDELAAEHVFRFVGGGRRLLSGR